MTKIESLDQEAFTDLVERIYASRDTNTDQGLAELMAACVYIHDSLLAVAEKRGIAEIVGWMDRKKGVPYINHPALPPGVDYPATILTRPVAL